MFDVWCLLSGKTKLANKKARQVSSSDCSAMDTRTWIHDNLCYLPINCNTGQHSQFLRCFIHTSASLLEHYISEKSQHLHLNLSAKSTYIKIAYFQWLFLLHAVRFVKYLIENLSCFLRAEWPWSLGGAPESELVSLGSVWPKCTVVASLLTQPWAFEAAKI